MAVDVYRVSPQRYAVLSEIGSDLLQREGDGAERDLLLANLDVSKFVGLRKKVFRKEEDCRSFVEQKLRLFTGLDHFRRVMLPEFSGVLWQLDEQRPEKPKVFAIAQVLEGGLVMHADATEENQVGLKAVASKLEKLLADWDAGIQGKTSGTHFANWRSTLKGARHFVAIYGNATSWKAESSKKRLRVEVGEGLEEGFPCQVALWHKPVNTLQLGRGLCMLYGDYPVRGVVVFLAQMYVLIRKFFELHRRSDLADGDFAWEKCSVSGFSAWEKLRAWSTCQNKSVDYKVGGRTLAEEVTFLNSCKLLRLHSVDPTDDPVQVQVRNNILGCGQTDDPADRVRTILRGIMVVHATRHYEYSSCVVGKTLLSPEEVVSCFATDGLRHVDLNLVRRATSEGRFMCGPASQPYELIGRSNIMDTFEGGLYHGSFEQAVRLLCAVGDGRGIGDASILDQVWDLLKGYKGFGGAENNAEGNVKGFVAKNIVFQGLRNILQVWGLERSATNRFVSGPNPCKLVAVALQKPWCSRSEHQQFYEDVLSGLRGVKLKYHGGDWVGLEGVDSMVLQDNLCKLVEVLQSTFTGRLFGKGRYIEVDEESVGGTSDEG